MSHMSPDHLCCAVAELCDEVDARFRTTSFELSEQGLWRELSTCLLSSQVPYDLAVAASDTIAETGFWDRPVTSPVEDIRVLSNILSLPFAFQGRSRRYRFPHSRARQLVATKLAVTEAAGGLELFMQSFGNALVARQWFIANAPGLGPKQASMFLRNIRVSDDLAILDRHVIRYMRAVGLWSGRSETISGFKAYQAHERVLRRHAEDLGHPIGIVDWAIWIVMRVADNRQLELSL